MNYFFSVKVRKCPYQKVFIWACGSAAFFCCLAINYMDHYFGSYKNKFNFQLKNSLDNNVFIKPSSQCQMHTTLFNKFKSFKQDNYSVHIVTLSTDKSYSEQLTVLMKSAILFTSKPLYFYIIYEDTDVPRNISSVINSWLFLREKSLVVIFMKLDWVNSLENITDPQRIKDMICGVKVVVYMMLTKCFHHLKKIIYVDSDFIFFEDPVQWWKLFDNFNSSQIAGLSPAGPRFIKGVTGIGRKYPKFYPPPLGLNAGIMLLDLNKLRQVNFTHDLVQYINNIRNLRNDQNLINFYFFNHGDKLYHLPCQYNYHMGVDLCKKRTNAIVEEICAEVHETGVYGMHGSAKTFYSGLGRKHALTVVFHSFKKFNPPQSSPWEFSSFVKTTMKQFWNNKVCDYITSETIYKRFVKNIEMIPNAS